MTLQHFAARRGGPLLIATGLVIGLGPPAALGAWTDNFDSYNTTQRLPDQSTWEAWNNDANASNFFATTAQWMSPPNALEIDGPDDAVHRYHGFTIGKWEYTAWMFVPASMVETQYFILVNTYPAVNSEDWSLQIELDCNAGVVRDFNNPAVTLPMAKGGWVDIRVVIDLDKDTQSCYYNGRHLLTKSWSNGVAPGGAVRLQAVDLWANNTTGPVYWDDMALLPAQLGYPSFSVDFHGPVMGTPDVIGGVPITEGEILLPPPPFVPLPGVPPPPSTALWGGSPSPGPDLNLAAWPGAVGHGPGQPGQVEIDALSYGTDFTWDPAYPWFGFWSLSVDEFAAGNPIPPPPANVMSEGMIGAQEASADIFVDAFIGPGPFPAPGPMIPAFATYDGNGFAPFGGPGYGLIEPDPPAPGMPDNGDNVDAFDLDEMVGPQYVPFPVYFSLDSAFVDPLEGPPVNSASAVVHGFVGGDVLVSTGPGAPPLLYAPAFLLGLDRQGPPDSDDLDALILWENGDGVFQPSQQPFDWHTGATDMVLFSVRRHSVVIGRPDSFWGVPIEEGDILGPPLLGGVSPFPMIFIPAEMIGLGTVRTGTQGPTGFGDDLDGLDASPDCNMNGAPDPEDIVLGFAQDCNANWVPDACDIVIGTSLDVDGNGIPDECECREDLDGSGAVDFADILAILRTWGNAGGPEDLDGSGVVDFADLNLVLSNWGPCPFT